MSTPLIALLAVLISLLGVVVIGIVAFARSTRRSDVRRTSVDDPGLDHRKS